MEIQKLLRLIPHATEIYFLSIAHVFVVLLIANLLCLVIYLGTYQQSGYMQKIGEFFSGVSKRCQYTSLFFVVLLCLSSALWVILAPVYYFLSN